MKYYCKVIIFVLTATMLITVMSGCQGTPVDEAKTLKVMDFRSGTNPPPGIKVFKANNPDYKLIIDGKYNGDMNRLIYDYIRQDDMDFDMIWVDDLMSMSIIYNKNKFVDLSKYESLNQELSKSIAGYQQTAKFEDKFIGVPMMFYGTNYGLIYDKVKCEELSIDVNDLDTFDKLEKKINEVNDKQSGAIKLPVIDINIMATILSEQYEAKYFNIFDDKTGFNSDGYKVYLDLLQEWTTKGLAGDMSSLGMGIDDLSDGSLIKITYLASVFGVTDYDFVKTPTIAEKDPIGVTTSWYIINHKTTKIDACVKFLDTIIKEELRNYPLSDAYVSGTPDIITDITPLQAIAYKDMYTVSKATMNEQEMIKKYNNSVKLFAQKKSDVLTFDYLTKAFDEFYMRRFNALNQYAK